MSLYDAQMLKDIKESTPQEKLNTLRPELLREIHRIHAVVAFLKSIDLQGTKNLPEELNYWTEALSGASDNLEEIIDAFTWAQTPNPFGDVEKQ
jgi:hypothetical protein